MTTADHSAERADLADRDYTEADERAMQMLPTLRDLALVTLVSIPIQAIATDLSVPAIIVGLLVLYGMCVVGLLLTKHVPFRLPSVAWISLVAIALTLPMLPWSGTVLPLVEGIDFLALAVPPLAYAGFAISGMEMAVMRRSGWKLLIVALFVFIGTYVGSAVVAELTLRLTGASL